MKKKQIRERTRLIMRKQTVTRLVLQADDQHKVLGGGESGGSGGKTTVETHWPTLVQAKDNTVCTQWPTR